MEHLYKFQITSENGETYCYEYIGRNSLEAFEDMANSGKDYLPKGLLSVIATRLDKVHQVSIKFEAFV